MFFVRLILIGLAALAAPAAAQDASVSGWPLEEVRAVDGRRFRGLIRGTVGGEVEFVEVVRPPNKPMYLVVRPIETKSIVAQQRLPDDERQRLIDRVDAFRYRSVIEAGRMENVRVEPSDKQGRSVLHYRGPWFSLASTADDETTRRSIVRIEQIFRAYRQLLPPRVEPKRRLRLLLLGSLEEYREFLREHELEITNPAFFAEQSNLIVAASDLTDYTQRLAQTRGQHNELRTKWLALDKGFEARLAAMRLELQKRGVPRESIDAEMNARRAVWKVEYDETLKQFAAADRRNDARFADVTEQMFRRLYHEGLHAYLENYVYPHDAHDVPIWLNEGLAQIFQNGQLDGDALRIDAPLASALRLAQDDLRSERPLRLDELLSAGQRDFLAGPESQGRSAKLYAHAWALAHYLVFQEGLLSRGALHDYASPAAAKGEPVAEFEGLVGMPLAEFEPQWREAVLQFKP